MLPNSSIIQASSVTFPSLSGLPPRPTLRSLGSASGTFTPASTASNAFPLLAKIFQASSLASIPNFHVEITIGFTVFFVFDKINFYLDKYLYKNEDIN
jgi:hypothetical protein